MKLQKLALTALALSMSTAFAGDNKDKQAQASSANQAPMAQSATANQSASSSANEAASSTNSSQSGMSSSQGATAQADPQVRQVQQALKDKGHDPGPADGIMGPQTKQALQGFQQAKGISGAGELDHREPGFVQQREQGLLQHQPGLQQAVTAGPESKEAGKLPASFFRLRSLGSKG